MEPYDLSAGRAKALRVTVAWSDPEGPLNSRAVLVNDLDLALQAPSEEQPACR